MNKREVRLEDGRYLIYYTFDDGSGACGSTASKAAASDSERESGSESPCQN